MDYKKIIGILFMILGLLFIVYPLYSAAAVSLIAGICLISFGFAAIIDGFSIWSMMANVSVIKILLGICAILLGIVFIYKIDALSFIVAYQFYLIAFVMIFVGISGLIAGSETMSKLTSTLILIMGIIAIFLAVYSITQPLYAAILVGICLIMEGIAFCT
ncbi:DUF308 domain-containing protein [Methanobrevibacter sp.]|uniref:DUF308 domain-containing protein n=1 Tax=Methanobrevibacter sp. TaxID=66852 RepID=UPI00386B6CA1